MLYTIERYHFVINDIATAIPSLKCKLGLEKEKYVEKSQFSYMYILDEKADCPATLKLTLGLLYDTFEVGKKVNHLVIAGDGATVRLLLNLKVELWRIFGLDDPLPRGLAHLKKFSGSANENILGCRSQRNCKTSTQTNDTE